MRSSTDRAPSRAVISSREFADDPFSFYRRWRESGEVHRLGEENLWLVLGFDDASSVLRQAGVFSSSPGKAVSPALNGADAPWHTELRRILQPFFAADLQRARRDAIRRATLERMEKVRHFRSFDAVADFSAPLAHTIASAWSGLTEDGALRIRGKAVLDVSASDVSDAIIPGGLIHRLSLTSGLEPRVVAELAGFFMMAGVETAREFVLFGLLELAKVSDPTGFPKHEFASTLVDELLRLQPPAHTLVRRATRDASIAGAAIPAGAIVWVSIAAANRDPSHFENPDSLEPGRKGTHLSFGFGPHYCLGSHLGQVEGEEILQALLPYAPALVGRAKAPEIWFVGPDGAPSLRQISSWQLSFNGIS